MSTARAQTLMRFWAVEVRARRPTMCMSAVVSARRGGERWSRTTRFRADVQDVVRRGSARRGGIGENKSTQGPKKGGSKGEIRRIMGPPLIHSNSRRTSGFCSPCEGQLASLPVKLECFRMVPIVRPPIVGDAGRRTFGFPLNNGCIVRATRRLRATGASGASGASFAA